MKFAANISTLWPDLPYLDRFEAAAEAGYDGVEVLFPYETPAKETQRALMRTGLEMALIAAPPPNYTGGVRGFAAVPGSEDRFRYDLRRALRYCVALRTPVLQVLPGAAEGEAARATLIGNLRAASETAPQDVVITISPSATEEGAGSLLNSYDLAAEILQEVAAPNVGLLVNSHDAQSLDGDVVSVMERHAGLIRHVHIADGPKGAADLTTISTVLMDIDYGGWVGGLFAPTELPEAHRAHLQTLSWA